MAKYINLINAVDNVPIDFNFDTLYKFYLPSDPRPHGFLIPEIVSQVPWTDEFSISHASKSIHLLPSSSPLSAEATAARSTAILNVLVSKMLSLKLFPKILNGKPSEPYLLLGSRPQPPGVQLQRFPAPLFGISSRGAHMTVYVRHGSGPEEVKIWVATRSRTSWTYPGKLDTSVAGGVKAGDTPLSCVAAEAAEEAGLDSDMVRERAVPAGCITYVSRGKAYGTVTPTLLYVFDLEVGADEVVLAPVDNEVEMFDLMSVREVKQAMFADRFKPNCNLVMIDFFLRHGILRGKEAEGLRERLHRRLPVPTEPEEVVEEWVEPKI